MVRAKYVSIPGSEEMNDDSLDSSDSQCVHPSRRPGGSHVSAHNFLHSVRKAQEPRESGPTDPGWIAGCQRQLSLAG